MTNLIYSIIRITPFSSCKESIHPHPLHLTSRIFLFTCASFVLGRANSQSLTLNDKPVPIIPDSSLVIAWALGGCTSFSNDESTHELILQTCPRGVLIANPNNLHPDTLVRNVLPNSTCDFAPTTVYTTENGTTISVDNSVRYTLDTTNYDAVDMADSLVQSYGAALLDEVSFSNRRIATMSSVIDAISLSNALNQLRGILHASPGLSVERTMSTDPFFDDQYQLSNQLEMAYNYGQTSIDVKALNAWELVATMDTTIIAFLDSGIDPHGEFNNGDGQTRLIIGYQANDNFSSNYTDLSGYSDYIPPSEYEGASNPAISDANIRAHGVACAGLAAASENGYGMQGLSPNSQIISVNILTGNVYFGLMNDDAGALVIASLLGADVINCSWHYNYAPGDENLLSSYFTDIFDYIHEVGRNGKGTVLVWASGNSGGTIPTPNNLSSVITVGGIAKNGNLIPAFNNGESLDLVVPSAWGNLADVVTTDMMGQEGTSESDYRDDFGGTSACAPIVSAAVALLLANEPDLSWEEVHTRLFCSAKDIGQIGWDALTGFGLLNVEGALSGCNTSNCFEDTYDFNLPYIVSGDQIINEATSFKYDITIPSGSSLTVNAAIHMGPSSKILVEPGGHLNLTDEGSISNNCSVFWRGIFSNGTVELEGIIEGADIGFSNGIPQGPISFPLQDTVYSFQNWSLSESSTSLITNAVFQNCGIGVYLPWELGGVWSNLSENPVVINNCKFLCNDQLGDIDYALENPSHYPNESCDYCGDANAQRRSAYGILAQNQLNLVCTNNEFINQEIGIRSMNSFFDIKNCDFTNNRFGIYSNQDRFRGSFLLPDQSIIANCSFTEISANSTPFEVEIELEEVFAGVPMEGYGPEIVSYNSAAIRLENMPQIQIDLCEFGPELTTAEEIEQTVDFQEIGIYANNCVSLGVHQSAFNHWQVGVAIIDSDSKFYDNTLIGARDELDSDLIFNNCLKDMVAVGDNGNLQVRCVTDKNDLLGGEFISSYGALGNQGRFTNINNSYPAGNKFYQYGGQLMIDQIQLQGSIYYMEYDEIQEYFNGSTLLNIPTMGELFYIEFLSNLVYFHHQEFTGDQPQPFTLAPTTGQSDAYLQECPVQLNGKSCSNFWEIIEDYDQEKTLTVVDSLIAVELTKLADAAFSSDGNGLATLDLLNAIYGEITDNIELEEYLLANSPLSTEVMEALLLREDLPDDQLLSIFYINSVIESSLHELLNARLEFTADDIAETIRSIFLYNIDAITEPKYRKDLVELRKIRRHLELEFSEQFTNDHGRTMAIDSIFNGTSYFDREAQLNYYTLLNEHELADSLLNEVSSQVNFHEIDRIRDLSLSLGSDSIAAQLLDNQLESIGNLSLDEIGLMRSTLSNFGINCPMTLPSFSPTSEKSKPSFEFFSVKPNIAPSFSVYPNPFSRELTLYLNPTENLPSRNFQVCLNNQTGAEVFTTSIKSLRDNHQITLALPDLAPGVYFINVFLNQEIVYSSKLICSK